MQRGGTMLLRVRSTDPLHSSLLLIPFSSSRDGSEPEFGFGARIVASVSFAVDQLMFSCRTDIH